MEYEQDFQLCFMRRTLCLVTEYKGPYEATLLINCLLGLLILPKELLVKNIPSVDFNSLADWGIKPTSIKQLGKCDYGHEHQPNLKQLIRRLRNAAAHFRIEPHHHNGEVHGYSFRDQNGFHAEISVSEIKNFVLKLNTHLSS